VRRPAWDGGPVDGAIGGDAPARLLRIPGATPVPQTPSTTQRALAAAALAPGWGAEYPLAVLVTDGARVSRG
jgi:hypothetical protein